jgi:hypothetical protein
MFESMVMMYALSKPPQFPVPRDQRAYTECVAERESEGRPDAVNPTGRYRGKYQFSAELARGATWHIMPWLKQWHPEPKKYAERLRKLPMNRWPESVQDAAFIMTLNYNGVKWSGKKHWNGGRWSCGKNGRR